MVLCNVAAQAYAMRGREMVYDLASAAEAFLAVHNHEQASLKLEEMSLHQQMQARQAEVRYRPRVWTENIHCSSRAPSLCTAS